MIPKEFPTNLSFERKLDVSYAVFYSGSWEEQNDSSKWLPIPIKETTVRGTVSHYCEDVVADVTKQESKKENANIQKIDTASLYEDADTLKMSFTLKILSNIDTPCSCTSEIFLRKLKENVQNYVKDFGYKALAERYAYNLASGRFLWRNRMAAEEVKIVIDKIVSGKKVTTWEFDGLNYSLRNFDGIEPEISSLGEVIAEGLMGNSFSVLVVTAYARMGKGTYVFPSQEFVNEDNKTGRKSKTLYDIDSVAAMHSQKIGNAIRTIDTWYPDYPENECPISVEPYGIVTNTASVYRRGKDVNFYDLIIKWILKEHEISEEQKHFVIAVLIRGGVFGIGKKGNKSKKGEE